MNHLNIAMTLAVLSFTCAGSSLAQTTYPDGRPSATLRLEAKDQGVILKHGDGPGQCDILGAREALIFEERGVYHLISLLDTEGAELVTGRTVDQATGRDSIPDKAEYILC